MVSKRCKQPLACYNNYIQNGRKAYPYSQCQNIAAMRQPHDSGSFPTWENTNPLYLQNSVCTCCCDTPQCNNFCPFVQDPETTSTMVETTSLLTSTTNVTTTSFVTTTAAPSTKIAPRITTSTIIATTTTGRTTTTAITSTIATTTVISTTYTTTAGTTPYTGPHSAPTVPTTTTDQASVFKLNRQTGNCSLNDWSQEISISA